MNNIHLPIISRKRGAWAYYRIKRQLKDPTLSWLRYQYMKADTHNDAMAREHIGDKISAHMLRVYKKRI